MKKFPYWPWVVLAALLIYPQLPLDKWFAANLSVSIGSEMSRKIFIYALLALGLNVVVGYSGLLQLGIAAFFGIGAYITGILTVPDYPFQTGFWFALLASVVGAALAGIVLGAPTLRLRGDYLAIVTLGFGEVVRFMLLNFGEITNGSRGLNPVPAPGLPAFLGSPDWVQDYRYFYYLVLGILVVVIIGLRNLERSRLGRALVAVREDELAAVCMGINVTRIKLTAFAIGSALAGLAGCLFASRLQATPGANSFDFNISIMVLAALIVGGLGNSYGAVLGAFLVFGFDSIVCQVLDSKIQKWFPQASESALLTFSNWRWLLYGLALVLMMRFKPEGLLPSERVKEEMHEDSTDPEVTRVGVE